MKLRYALLGSIVVAAFAPGSLWAQPAGSAMDNSLQQRAPGPGPSEQDRSNAALGRKAGASSQAGQGAAVGASPNGANRGAAAAPAGGTRVSALPAKKLKQHPAVAPVRSSPQATNRSTVSKMPGAAALPGSIKARAAGPTVAQQRNAIGALSPAQSSGPMTGRPGPGAVAAREPSVLAAPRPGSSALGGGTPSAPANAVARHSPVSATVGGAPAYEPPRNAVLAVIGGTMMKRNKL